jgi:hypothetical protein
MRNRLVGLIAKLREHPKASDTKLWPKDYKWMN